MVLNHGDHGVLYILLFSRKAGLVLAKLVGQLLDDEVRVADLFTVELDKGQKSSFGAKFGVVVDVLRKEMC